ncbi:GspMb/PilO family protein [Effusibacillus lacus]|uniref:Uncharacterized protein n=1 Tax=Effusibacillus lacus TaxID=1348429 RepID=A0A292YIF3_9BACL|nr:GspMb/PilO family protein [Effusibacillus lacus]GAX88493.1 hypothetical protein EFBL_0102 [Effusibacillus lacus]
MLSSLTFPQKIVLLLSGCLFLSGGAFGYLSWQKEKAASEIKGQADAVSQQVTRLQQKIQQKVETPDWKKLGRAIPKDWEMPLFFADLTLAAKDSQVTLVSVTPAITKDEPTDKKSETSTQNGSANNSKQGNKKETALASPPPELAGIQSLEITVSAEGKPEDLIQFLDRLQQMQRLIWINEYNVCFCKDRAAGGSNSGGTKQSSGKGAMPKLDLKLSLYSHSPWNNDEANTIEWPLPIEPAGNERAFGRP